MTNQEFAKLAVLHGLHHSEDNLSTYLDTLFSNIDLKGKSFLDIGGGTGLFTFFAASQGAPRAVCMEPLGDGSTPNVTNKFDTFRKHLNSKCDLQLDRSLFQDYGGEPFDVIFLHNAINHLDEEACVELKTSQDARSLYIKLLTKLSKLVNSSGIVIVADAGRRNFFGDLGLTNPVMKTIEWEKHQQPKFWAKLFEEAGFHVEKIRWNTFNTLGKSGRLLLGHFIPSYFTLSHFRMYLIKK